MDSKTPGFHTIDEYIALFPEPIQATLSELRAAIRAAAPEAQERISYQMPTFYQHGNLVHFAAWKSHIGFYPTAHGAEVFREELAAYDGAKGSVRFPLDRPLPLELIGRIVKARVAENLQQAERKAGKRKQNKGAHDELG